MKTNVMIDIETLGTSPGAAIVSVGAIDFDTRRRGLGDSIFYKTVTLESAVEHGEVDGGALRFWLQQPLEATSELLRTEEEGALGIKEVLIGLQHYFPYGFSGGVWANGPSFDLIILETMYKKLDLECPWKFWQHRCCRTVKDLGKTLRIQTSEFTEDGRHHALEDAKRQAINVTEVLSAVEETDFIMQSLDK